MLPHFEMIFCYDFLASNEMTLLFLLLEPTVEIQDSEFVVQEAIGTLNIPLRRKGDLKPLIKIVCITIPGEIFQEILVASLAFMLFFVSLTCFFPLPPSMVVMFSCLSWCPNFPLNVISYLFES